MASVGQGGYLSPMAAFAAAQMQHMATINGLPGAPLTPTSGNCLRSYTEGVFPEIASTTVHVLYYGGLFSIFLYIKS